MQGQRLKGVDRQRCARWCVQRGKCYQEHCEKCLGSQHCQGRSYHPKNICYHSKRHRRNFHRCSCHSRNHSRRDRLRSRNNRISFFVSAHHHHLPLVGDPQCSHSLWKYLLLYQLNNHHHHRKEICSPCPLALCLGFVLHTPSASEKEIMTWFVKINHFPRILVKLRY